jgi:hypothetical protein
MEVFTDPVIEIGIGIEIGISLRCEQYNIEGPIIIINKKGDIELNAHKDIGKVLNKN